MANDVAEALGYSDREQAVELYCEDVRNFKEVAPEKRAFEISSKTRLIKELDIAKLIHRSPLASTGAFYDWVIPIAKRDKDYFYRVDDNYKSFRRAFIRSLIEEITDKDAILVYRLIIFGSVWGALVFLLFYFISFIFNVLTGGEIITFLGFILSYRSL